MDDHSGRTRKRADAPDSGDVGEFAARRRGGVLAIMVLLLVVAVPVAVLVWGDIGENGTPVLAPDDGDGAPAGTVDGAAPARYTVTVEASPAGEAPFAITGAQATVAGDRDGVPVQLTLTSRQHVLLQGLWWEYVNDRRNPDLAVAPPHCTLSYVSDRARMGCDLIGRQPVIRPDEPVREELLVCLLGTEPVGTYDYTRPIEWWHLDADTRGPEISKIDDQPADGRVEVTVRIRVQPTSETAPSRGAEQDDARGRCTPPDQPSPAPTPSSPSPTQGSTSPDANR